MPCARGPRFAAHRTGGFAPSVLKMTSHPPPASKPRRRFSSKAVQTALRHFDRWCPLLAFVTVLVLTPGPLPLPLAAACSAAAAGWWLLRCTRPGRKVVASCALERRLHPIRDGVISSLELVLGQRLPCSVEESAAGFIVTVDTPRGLPDAAILDRCGVLASDLAAWRVRPLPALRHGQAQLLVQMTDPLRTAASEPWKPTLVGEWPLTAPVPVGRYEDGAAAVLDLWAQTVLVGGSPGSGKSVFGWLPLLAAALDPSALLVVLDLKPHGIETAPIAERADHTVHTPEDACTVLSRVWALVCARNEQLRAHGWAKVPTDDPVRFPPVMVFVDEAAELSMTEAGREALLLLQRIVAVGRASGVTVVLLTQKPDAHTIPSALRDLFAQRVAFRVGNRPQAETILGVVQAGVAPWEVSLESPGVGFLLGPDGRTERFRATFLDRRVVWNAAGWATVCRQDWIRTNPDAVSKLPELPNSSAPVRSPKRRRTPPA